MSSWFAVLSDLFVNIAAGWFILVFIEPQFSGFNAQVAQQLILRVVFGILALGIAKKFREESIK